MDRHAPELRISGIGVEIGCRTERHNARLPIDGQVRPILAQRVCGRTDAVDERIASRLERGTRPWRARRGSKLGLGLHMRGVSTTATCDGISPSRHLAISDGSLLEREFGDLRKEVGEARTRPHPPLDI